VAVGQLAEQLTSDLKIKGSSPALVGRVSKSGQKSFITFVSTKLQL
jgi:hypothetical protein